MKLHQLITASALALTVAACGSSGGPKAFDASQSPAAAAERYVKTWHTGDLKGVRQVAIPYFQIEFFTRSGASAQAWRSSDQASSQSSVSYKLVGISDADLQAMTDQLYAKLIADMRAIGVEVIPPPTLRAQPAYQALERMAETKNPFEGERSRRGASQSSRVFSATGVPLYLDPGDGTSPIGIFGTLGRALNTPQLREEELAKALKVPVLRVRYSVDFADLVGKASAMETAFGSSANTSITSRFGVGVEPTFSLMSAMTPSGKHAGIGFEGNVKAITTFQVKEPVTSANNHWTREVKEVNKLSNAAETVAVALIGMALGGGAGANLKDYELVVDKPAWTQAANETLIGTQKMFVALFQKSM